ncbi:hypothetical protein K449DRAFT_179251 [Hypoxylon sp. EC38]|nr:hypothetical protein K449DRAFT_179251 [Hypoxylon sp. EC38]
MGTWHLRKYIDWGVGRDMTVEFHEASLCKDQALKHYAWQDVEVTTPALYATEKSWAEIHRVVTALQDNFWIHSPSSAGLHVHYGRGTEYLAPAHLRRLAALLFAADPIIAQMHPPWRRDSNTVWAPSNRLYSYLAHGTPAEEARKRINNETDELEPLVPPAPDPDRPEPEPRPTRKREHDFVSIFRRGTLEGYRFSTGEFNFSEPDFINESMKLPGTVQGVPISIRTAAQELFSAKHPSVITCLMENIYHGRMAYNLRAYGARSYRVLDMGGGISGPVSYQPKRTVEFRQAAGTVDPDEVIAHGKIVVRICETALKDTNEIWKMILDCADGEKVNT